MKLKRKLLVFAAVALGSLLSVGSVLAADPVNRRQKPLEDEAPAAFSRTWNGFYVGGNVGYEMFAAHGFLEGLGATDWSYGGVIGVDGQLSKHWVIGAALDYQIPRSVDFDRGIWTVSGRAGYLMTPDFLIYGLGGYSQVLNLSDVNGVVAGGGVEYRLGAGWSTKLEYRHTFVDVHSIDVGDLNSIRAGLSYKFGGN